MTYEIHITRRCNFKCPSCDCLCNVVNDPTSDLTMDEVVDIAMQIESIDPNVKCIRVIGGEPTLNDKCFDICKYVKEHIKAEWFELGTNHTNNDISGRIEKDLGFKVLAQDGSTDPSATAANKIKKHRNLYISPKCEKKEMKDPYFCVGLSDLCGIAVHKYKGRLVWIWCGAGSSVCKLLKREDFLKPTLKDLFASGFEDFANDICCNCYKMLKENIYAKDTPDFVSECFKEGLEDMKKYNSEVNKHK